MADKKALDAQRLNAFLVAPEDLVLIEDKTHPRYDPRVELPINEGLVTSILSEGFHSTIRAYRDGTKAVVLSGIQRTKAAREANRRLREKGLDPIRVEVRLERGDEGALFGVQVLANENRQDTSPMERARLLQRLIAFGRSEEQAGAVIGLDKTQAKRLLSLLDCAPQVQRAVEAGKCPPTAASKLAKLPREEQVAALDQVLAEGPSQRGKAATVARVSKAIRKDNGPQPPSRKEIKAAVERADAHWPGRDIADVLDWAATGNLREGSHFARWITSDEHAAQFKPKAEAEPEKKVG